METSDNPCVVDTVMNNPYCILTPKKLDSSYAGSVIG